MKRLRLPASVALVALLVGLNGCSNIQPGNDPVVVNAERAIGVATPTFDELFKLEYTNHAVLKQDAPQVVAGVNVLRRNAPKWIATAVALTKAYKQNRTDENKANLLTAIKVLQSGIDEAQKYMTKIQTGGH
jgi:hypothetical protein